MIADMSIEIDAMRMLTWRAAALAEATAGGSTAAATGTAGRRAAVEDARHQ